MSAREQAIAAVVEAITDPGPQPGYHWKIMARQRAEWPTLWAALDRLVETDAAERQGEACMKHLWGSSCILHGPHGTHRNQYGEEWVQAPTWA